MGRLSHRRRVPSLGQRFRGSQVGKPKSQARLRAHQLSREKGGPGLNVPDNPNKQHTSLMFSGQEGRAIFSLLSLGLNLQ